MLIPLNGHLLIDTKDFLVAMDLKIYSLIKVEYSLQ